MTLPLLPDFAAPSPPAPSFAAPAGWHWLGRRSDAWGLRGAGRSQRYAPPEPTRRFRPASVDSPLTTGIRAIDALLPMGRGQRTALLAGGGVGKSVLLSMLARGCAADHLVVALIGERAREIEEFWAELGFARRRAAHLVAAPAADSAEARLAATERALAYADWLRGQGKDVLLLVDSLSRVADAFAELNPGRSPGTFLQRLIERAGRDASGGSVTAVFTVLDESGASDVPISNAVRAAVDGHVYLSRALAERGVFPAIDLLRSASRPMQRIADAAHRAAAARVRAALALAADSADMRLAGLYEAGANPVLDAAIAVEAEVRAWLRQGGDEVSTADDALMRLLDVAARCPD